MYPSVGAGPLWHQYLDVPPLPQAVPAYSPPPGPPSVLATSQSPIRHGAVRGFSVQSSLRLSPRSHSVSPRAGASKAESNPFLEGENPFVEDEPNKGLH